MKWILITLLVLAGIVLLVVVIGILLPQKHRVSRTILLRQAPDKVWSLITGPPNWRPDIQKSEELPPRNGHRVWRETDQSGQTITYEATESVPLRRWMTRIADDKLPFGGTWTFEIAPVEQGSSLTITEDGEVYNPIFRFVSRFMTGHTASMDRYMQALETKLK
ncbi:MAG TPA: SRPBCC family protein [Alphaproteobacteria bacterium]|nr:SRPBCC family protein [Alphaproteobacteria bacterium]